MTSKLKCPFCGKELVPTTMGDNDTDLYASVWLPIKNCICNTAASKKIWKALIQAKQDLEIATKALKQIVCADKDGKPLKGVVSCWLDMDELNKCIEQIEYKD